MNVVNVKTLVACVAAVSVMQLFAAVPGYSTLIAHRGESLDAPENTLPAYRMAVERGFGFECDIYLSPWTGESQHFLKQGRTCGVEL